MEGNGGQAHSDVIRTLCCSITSSAELITRGSYSNG